MKPHSTGSSGAHPHCTTKLNHPGSSGLSPGIKGSPFLLQGPKGLNSSRANPGPWGEHSRSQLALSQRGTRSGPFTRSWNLVTLGFVPRWMESFPHHCPTPTQASTFLPMSTAGLARFPSPFPTRKPIAASSHNAKDNAFFKALLEPATIKKLPLPSLFCHFPSSGSADPGCHKLEAILSMSRRSNGTALFHTSLGYSCFTSLATLSAPYTPILACTTSHVDKSVVGAQ